MMKNRKGGINLSAEEIVGLILGIIILFFIASVVWNLISVGNPEFEKASKLLTKFEGKIEAVGDLEEGEMSTLVVQSLCTNPESCGWYLHAWSEEETSGPDRCFFGNCVCLCQGTTTGDCQNAEKSICNDKVSVGVDVIGERYGKLEQGAIDNIDQRDEIFEESYIDFTESFTDLNLVKENGNVVIKYSKVRGRK